MHSPGGMLRYGIPSLQAGEGRDRCRNRRFCERLGVEIRCGVEVGKDVTLD